MSGAQYYRTQRISTSYRLLGKLCTSWRFRATNKVASDPNYARSAISRKLLLSACRPGNDSRKTPSWNRHREPHALRPSYFGHLYSCRVLFTKRIVVFGHSDRRTTKGASCSSTQRREPKLTKMLSRGCSVSLQFRSTDPVSARPRLHEESSFRLR